MPSTQIIQSCLRTESASREVRYVDLAPNSFNEKYDEIHKTTSKTITFRSQEVGIWETADSKQFGLVYGAKKIPVRSVIKIGKHLPVAFNPYTAQWGDARDTNNSYLCITFNFEGLGESGAFQNIRGVYLIETTGRRPTMFYTVGDIRKTSTQIGR